LSKLSSRFKSEAISKDPVSDGLTNLAKADSFGTSSRSSSSDDTFFDAFEAPDASLVPSSLAPVPPAPPVPQPVLTIGIRHERRVRGEGVVIWFGHFHDHAVFHVFNCALQNICLRYGQFGYGFAPRVMKNGTFRVDWKVGTEYYRTDWLRRVLMDPAVRKLIPLDQWRTTLPRFEKDLAFVQEHHAHHTVEPSLFF
jgi:hypothetical protein